MFQRRCAALAVVLGFCGAPVLAQQRAGLFGRILDTSEAGISEALVSAVDQQTGFRRSATSEPGGAYALGSLDPGTYKITVRRQGFVSVVRFDVRLAPGAARADFVLPVGSVEETITVVGTAPLVREDDASAGRSFDREELERIPLNGRGLLTALEMAPGTNVVPATRGEAGQFTASGQRPNTNYFTVDGVSANTGVSAGGLPAQFTGGALPGLSAFGSLDSLISREAIEEFRVQTSTAGAEFGRLPGASIALMTRSGTGQFHGSTAFRLRHELAAANDWFSDQAGYSRAPLRLQDAAQTLGGPAIPRRAFFFLSYEHLGMRQPYVWRQPVPNAEARLAVAEWARPVVALFPLPTGAPLTSGLAEWVGRSHRPAGLDAGSARFDAAPSQRVTMMARYSDSPSSNEFGSTQVNRLDLRLRSLTLALNAHPGGRTAIDVRANESQAAASSRWTQDGASGAGACGLEPLTLDFLGYAASCDYLVRFTIGGVGQLVSGREGDRRQRQFQVVGSAALERGSHTLRLGADFRRITAIRRDSNGALGVIADSMASLLDKRYVWIARSQAIRRSATVHEVSLWAHDTWRLGDRLTIAAGLRWEFSPSPVPDEPVFFLNYSTESIYSLSRALWPNSYRDFAPRLGLAWRLSRGGGTVLRVGGGLYYDSSLSIATDIINGGPLGISQFGSGMSAPFGSLLSFGFMPDLRLPRVAQWNVAIEHAFGLHDVLSAGYVGSAGRSLIRREVGGDGNTSTAFVALTSNRGASDYHALQVQYRRRLAKGLEGSASYAWSHSLDNASSDAFLLWAGRGAGAGVDWGASDFDLRHALAASASYAFDPAGQGRVRSRLRGWSLDAVFHARTGFPITVLGSEQYLGIALTNAFRPDRVWGQPLWLTDSNAPGGRRLNPAAFRATGAGRQGNLGRNAISGFGMWQLDAGARRTFRGGERLRIELRADAFNLLNHPSFADPTRYLNNALFGRSPSMLNMMLGTGSPASGLAPSLQTGGPRMLEGSVRLVF